MNADVASTAPSTSSASTTGSRCNWILLEVMREIVELETGDDDLRALGTLVTDGVEGVIVGKALYAGALTLTEALELTRGGDK